MQFVLLALVVLPVLPDATFGPYAVFNPREMWLMAVLIVGLSLGRLHRAQVLRRARGHRRRRPAGRPHLQHGHHRELVAPHPRPARGRARGGARHRHRVHRRLRPRAGRDRGGGAPVPARGRAAHPRAGRRHGRGRRRALAAHPRRGARDAPTASSPPSLKTAFTFAALYGIVLLAVAVVNDRFGAQGLYAGQRDLRPDGRRRDHALGRAARRLRPGRAGPGRAARRGGRAVEPRVQGRHGGAARRPPPADASSRSPSACSSLAGRGAAGVLAEEVIARRFESTPDASA